MIRKKKPFNPDLIISADWHLRDTQPKCRTDNFWEAQWGKVKQVLTLSGKLDCPIYLAGDLFQHWKTSPFLLNKTIREFLPLNGFIYSIIGNHDMPGHNIENMERSGLQILFDTDIIHRILFQVDWGTDPAKHRPLRIKKRTIVFAHIMTYKDIPPWPGCEDPECHELFDWFPDADLIVTGHNHRTFTARKGKQLLVNPGSLTRHKADQIDHRPCVFFYDSKQHKLKRHYLKIKKGVISREHIEIKKHKDKRLNAFIEKLKQGWDAGLSFEENIERGIKENKIPKRVQDIIYTWMEE